MRDIVLRAARPADVPAIAALVQRAYADYVPRVGRRPGPMDADYPELIRTARALVAEAGETVAGVLVLIGERDRLLIANVAVAPEQQGAGLGRRLLEHAEREAAVAGLESIRLSTHVTMTENRALYAHLGYRETGTFEGEGFQRVNLVKPLGPALRLRRAGLDDVAAIEAHAQAGLDGYAAFAGPDWRPPRLADERARTRELLSDPGTWAMIATRAAGSAGHVAFFPGRERSLSARPGDWRARPVVPGLAQLWQLFVLEPWWGTALADRLHVAARTAMVARGMTRARLYTPAGQHRARRFYERRGWRAAGEPEWNEGLALELVEYRLELS